MRVRPVGLLGIAVLAAGVALTARSLAQPPPGSAQIGGVDDECQVGETVTFDSGSTVVNLDAQSKLNDALHWVTASTGRRLVLLGADGPRPEDLRLGAVRASSAASFLIAMGANPSVVSRGDFRDLSPSRFYTRPNVDSVVVLICDVAEPVP